MKDFVFLQSGVDLVLRNSGYPQILDAENVELTFRYPCRFESYFMHHLADARGKLKEAEMTEQQQLAKKVRLLISLQCRKSCFGTIRCF